MEACKTMCELVKPLPEHKTYTVFGHDVCDHYHCCNRPSVVTHTDFVRLCPTHSTRREAFAPLFTWHVILYSDNRVKDSALQYTVETQQA